MTDERWGHDDWVRLGKAVKRRRAALGFTQESFIPHVHRLVGDKVLSTSTLRKVENAKQESYDPIILPSICRGLRWGPYDWEKILDGVDPEALLSTDSTMPAHASDSDHLDMTGLPDELRQQLRAMADEHRRMQQT